MQGRQMTDAILYSYVRCPYAARARLALIFAGIDCQLREVDLSNKPAAMLQISPKATVPVLQLADQRVIDESLVIMEYAAATPAGKSLLPDEATLRELQSGLISHVDTEFSKQSFRYRFPREGDEQSPEFYRQQGEVFLQRLEDLLAQQAFLRGAQPGFADLAIYPFVRGFVDVDPAWFAAAPYQHLRNWLAALADDVRVQQAYRLREPWQPGAAPVYLIAN